MCAENKNTLFYRLIYVKVKLRWFSCTLISSFAFAHSPVSLSPSFSFHFALRAVIFAFVCLAGWLVGCARARAMFHIVSAFLFVPFHGISLFRFAFNFVQYVCVCECVCSERTQNAITKLSLLVDRLLELVVTETKTFYCCRSFYSPYCSCQLRFYNAMTIRAAAANTTTTIAEKRKATVLYFDRLKKNKLTNFVLMCKLCWIYRYFEYMLYMRMYDITRKRAKCYTQLTAKRISVYITT